MKIRMKLVNKNKERNKIRKQNIKETNLIRI